MKIKWPRYTLEVLGHHFFIGWFPSFTIILVGVYHLPKGTTIFEMVVDFQGIYIYLYATLK